MIPSSSQRLRLVRPGVFALWCPGCMCAHQLDVHAVNADGKVVGWDGDHERPTVEPTLKFPGCEFLLRAGVMYFLSNCTHPLVGQTVPLPHFPLP